MSLSGLHELMHSLSVTARAPRAPRLDTASDTTLERLIALPADDTRTLQEFAEHPDYLVYPKDEDD